MLRYYQKEAVDCVKDGVNGILVLPTGTGKSHVISGTAEKFPYDFILVLQPSKEILKQNHSKLLKTDVDPDEIGIYSASLNQKEIKRITFATIGSIKDYEEFYKFKIIIIDECHYVNCYAGQYERLIRYNSPKILIGLTATPYRMHTTPYGCSWKFLHCSSLKSSSNMFNELLYVYQNKQAFKDNYILKPDYYEHYYNTKVLKIKGNEYSEESILDYNESINLHDKVVDIVSQSNAKHNLIFTTSIEEAKIISDKLRFFGIPSSEVSSKNKPRERDKILSNFKSGNLKAIVNVGILTTGFDFPALDCVIGARPTKSLALYYQMVGRGVRICEGKTSWDYHDLCGNIKTFGKVEDYVIEGKDRETCLRNGSGYLIRGYSQEELEDGGDWVIPFGKFKGIRIGKVNAEYINYCLNELDNFFYKKQFELELFRRAEL